MRTLLDMAQIQWQNFLITLYNFSTIHAISEKVEGLPIKERRKAEGGGKNDSAVLLSPSPFASFLLAFTMA